MTHDIAHNQGAGCAAVVAVAAKSTLKGKVMTVNKANQLDLTVTKA